MMKTTLRASLPHSAHFSGRNHDFHCIFCMVTTSVWPAIDQEFDSVQDLSDEEVLSTIEVLAFFGRLATTMNDITCTKEKCNGFIANFPAFRDF